MPTTALCCCHAQRKSQITQRLSLIARFHPTTSYFVMLCFSLFFFLSSIFSKGFCSVLIFTHTCWVICYSILCSRGGKKWGSDILERWNKRRYLDVPVKPLILGDFPEVFWLMECNFEYFFFFNSKNGTYTVIFLYSKVCVCVCVRG